MDGGNIMYIRNVQELTIGLLADNTFIVNTVDDFGMERTVSFTTLYDLIRYVALHFGDIKTLGELRETLERKGLV